MGLLDDAEASLEDARSIGRLAALFFTSPLQSFIVLVDVYRLHLLYTGRMDNISGPNPRGSCAPVGYIFSR